MSDDHAVEASDLGREQLLAQIRPAVDEQALSAAFDQNRCPQAIVSRFGGIALTPVVPDLRNACGRSAAFTLWPG
jgi:hypothetical protein